LLQLAGNRQPVGEHHTLLVGEPCADGGIVGGRAGIGVAGQAAAQRQRGAAA